jgi:hypothetical protein
MPQGQKAVDNSVRHLGRALVAPAAPPWVSGADASNEVMTHNLEGGVVIAQPPHGDETDQLKSIVRQPTAGDYRKIILEPYPV